MSSNKPATELLRIGKSRIDGQGAFARQALPARRKIADMSGEVIRAKEAWRRAKSIERIAMIELPNGYAIDLTECTSPLRYVNHCCSPNTWLRVFNYRVEFYALREIAKGEELTCDYGSTHHQGTRPCGCKAANCRGFI